MDTYDACELAFRRGCVKGAAECGVYAPQGCRCVNNAKVFGLEDSIRGAKFPMAADVSVLNSKLTDGIRKLAQSGRGEGHDQWLTGVIVQFDLTFSNKAWVEAERYHFLDFVSSQSTMHRLAAFDLGTLYNEYTDPGIIKIIRKKKYAYEKLGEELSDPSKNLSPARMQEISEERERLYLEMLYSNPAGCMLTARMTTNYRQLKTVYAQRRFHRLPEWREFCDWIETLPHSELITGKTAENGGENASAQSGEGSRDASQAPKRLFVLKKDAVMPEKEGKTT